MYIEGTKCYTQEFPSFRRKRKYTPVLNHWRGGDVQRGDDGTIYIYIIIGALHIGRRTEAMRCFPGLLNSTK